MLLMFTDNELYGPDNQNTCLLAQSMAKDLLRQDADIAVLLKEAEELLTAVDAAISTSELKGDPDWGQMQVGWAFFGPSIFRRLEILKLSEFKAKNKLEKLRYYSMLSVILVSLTIRRQTLELNNIVVFK